ncbi:GGDEF domain-containing protein [Maridesulfovibrio sp.]|uniref:GGDEF domain-containing protein n=1 Tax=Maridesulfovibrio sp. TaxID=2795000 RepID=UPI002A18E68F|nr:GGDEF domain-containing protein [Maridesulfovibrio sp.]
MNENFKAQEMRQKKINGIRYKLTLPLIIIMSLAAVYLFHTIIIDGRNYSSLRSGLLEIKLNTYETAFSDSATGYDLHRLKGLVNEFENYPDNRKEQLFPENTAEDFFQAAQQFMQATESGDKDTVSGSAKTLDRIIDRILLESGKKFKAETGSRVKIEYGLLFLICVFAVVHFMLVDKPMRNELLRSLREKEICNSTIRKLAERDTLTNLPGRMKFYEESEREISSAARYGSDLTLIKMDISNFKDINLKHGQKAGDKLLAGFARTVRKHLRRPDSFFRVGGDKFIILAPHTTVKNALNLAEKIDRIIKTDRALLKIPFSLNTGIAACTAEDTAETLLEKVDAALKKAKQDGPGSVCSA